LEHDRIITIGWGMSSELWFYDHKNAKKDVFRNLAPNP
jgi:hypothetical protein